MEMQHYFGGAGDGDADWLHQLATLPPLPMSSSLPPPLLMSSEGSCLPMAATAAALPLGDCSSALMIRAEEQMGCLQMIPPPVVTDDVYISYAPDNVDVLPPFPAGLDDPTAGLDDALLMDSFSDIDLEEFADAIGPKIKTEPLDEAMEFADADYDFAAQAQQARPVVIMNQEPLDAPRGLCPVDDPDEDDSTVVAVGYEAATTVGYAEQKQARPAPRRVRKSGGGSRPAAAGKSLDHIGFEELRTYFYMPITKAAREMNVGLTVLKKRCRELGVARWPHRKMKSLRSLILNIQEMGKGATSPAAVQVELEALERYCARMEENPAIELTEQTKKLRQACFKENYKRRRAAASVNMLDHCYNDLGGDEQMPLPQMGFFGF